MKATQIKILLVDSDQSSLATCQKILSEKGFQVEQTTSTSDAVQKAKDGGYHLVITEIDFPGQMSGFELIKKMRERHRYTCAIILTSNPSMETAIESALDAPPIDDPMNSMPEALTYFTWARVFGRVEAVWRSLG